MMKWIKIKDDFLPNFDTCLGLLKDVKYGDFVYNNKKYTGVGQATLPVKALIEDTLGVKVMVKNSHLRKGNKNTKLTHYIHADSPEAQYAMVLHLKTPRCKTGTAFWQHKYTGLHSLPQQFGKALFDVIDNDTWNENKWNLTEFCESKPNRAVFFDSSLFHSRWPKNLPLEENEEPRLVFVCFFDVIKPEDLEDNANA